MRPALNQRLRVERAVLHVSLGLVSIVSSLVWARPIYRDTLPNGLEVISYIDQRLPLVDIALVCRSGASADPEGKAGLANGTVRLLTRGTRSMSADSVASVVEFLGAEFDANCSYGYSAVTLRMLARDLVTGVELLTDAVRNPAFDSVEVELAREQGLAVARDRYDYPAARVALELRPLVFPGQPYGREPYGDTVSLRVIRRQDLIDFHRIHYVPNNCLVVAVGDLDRAGLRQMLLERLGDWQPGPVPEQQVPEVAFPARLRVKVITRPEMNQTYCMFGRPGISLDDPDWLPTTLMTYVLGGGALGTRLGDAVREQEGLAYDVRCYFDQDRSRGGFWASVQTAKPREAIAIMFREIERMQTEGMTQAELNYAQNYLAGSYPIRLSSNRGKLMEVIRLATNGLGLDWIDRYPALVRSVTLDQANAAARSRLRPRQYVMVVMGNVTREDLGLDQVEWLE